MVETPFEVDPATFLLSTWKGWKGRDAFLSVHGKELSEKGRLLLFSDGSLVKSLEALLMKDITIDVEEQHRKGEWLKRGVWLQGDGKRLVFAFSIIPMDSLSPRMLERILKGSRPLGLIVEESMPFHRKEDLRFGIVHWPEKAMAFGFHGNCRLWARRYRIATDKGHIASILEIFSPALMERTREDVLP